MAFDNLPPQSPINPLADVYGQVALDLSRLAAMDLRAEFDVAYGEGPWRRLDIYQPRQAGRDLPVFLNFHGGGFTHGYKEWLGLNAPPLVAGPAIYISVGYELAPVGKIDAPLGDALTALSWVSKNIAAYGGSPDRIHVGGHSAGAVLSALMTLRKDLYRAYGLPETAIKACFPFSGTYDYQHGDIYGQATTLDKAVPDADAAAAMSPIAFVSGNTTPFFVSWGENDGELVKATGAAFTYALRQQPGARAEAHMFPQLDHFWMHIDQQLDANLWNRTVNAWMAGDPRTTPVPPA
jgi:acetyl esterase/lipase